MARAVPGVLGFLAVMIYTRLLSPREYGLYTLAFATVSIVVATCFEWIGKSTLRYFEESKRKGDLSVLISTIIHFTVMLSVVLLALWFVAIALLQNVLSPDLVAMLKVASVILVAHAGYIVILVVRQAAQESAGFAIYSVVNAVSKLAIGVSLLYFVGMGPEAILIAMAVASGAVFGWDIIRLYRKGLLRLFSFSAPMFKEIAAYGLPMAGFSITILVTANANRYMIAYFLTEADVGIYQAGQTLAAAALTFPVSILLLAAYPVIMETFDRASGKEAAALLRKTFAVYFVFMTPLVFGVAVLSKSIIGTLLGKEYGTSFLVVPWVAAGAFCLGLTQYMYKPFELKKKTKVLFLIATCVAVLNIILNYLFIPRVGIVGAAGATFISYLAYLLVTWLLSRKLIKWSFPWSTIAKAVSCSVAMYLFLFLFAHKPSKSLLYLAVNVLLGAVCYFAGLLAMRERTILAALSWVSNRVRRR